jgi:hypothetical protein
MIVSLRASAPFEGPTARDGSFVPNPRGRLTIMSAFLRWSEPSYPLCRVGVRAFPTDVIPA